MVNILPFSKKYDACYMLLKYDMAKEENSKLGLHRKGVLVQYSPFPQLQATIEVCINSDLHEYLACSFKLCCAH